MTELREYQKQSVRAVGHWLSAQRKWKRKQRRDKQRWQNIHATQPSEVWQRKSRGYRKHIRRMKAKRK